MKATLTLFSILLALPLFAQHGWKSLFNGEDFSGWIKRNGQAEYKIENGEIIGITKTGTPNTFLCTEKSYGDFILEIEVKIDPTLNSGIQFRSNSLPHYRNGAVHGYQAEVDPSPRGFSGGIYDEQRRGWLCTLSENPAGQKAFKNGGWNHFRIEAIGHEIRIWVNQVNTASLVDDWTAKGFIGLQVHGIGENEQLAGREIRWRNIRIRTEAPESERWPLPPGAVEINLIPNTLTNNEMRKGWRLLWDGKTTNDWQSSSNEGFLPKGWAINDGTLSMQADENGEPSKNDGIITRDEFSDFELSLEFKLSKGANGGIQYFVQSRLNQEQSSTAGCKYQLLDDTGHPDAERGVGGNRTLASLYDLLPAANLSVPGRAKEFRGLDEWNQARIVARGNHVEHWLNGFKVVEYERNTPLFRALVAHSRYGKLKNFGNWPQGHLLLQVQDGKVSFRSIKIREF